MWRLMRYFYQFSFSHIDETSCVTQLQICSEKVARVDAELTTANCEGKIRWYCKAGKSWERAMWAIVGDQKLKKIMKMMIYTTSNL